MFDAQKKDVLNAALKLDRYGLIALSGGNVSWRMDSGEVLVTPSGMIYDEMVPEDILVVDLEGNIIEGERKASVDTEALLYIYKNMPQVNAVIHTHQPYATGLGLVMDELPCNLSTMANATEGPVAVAEYGDPGSLSMGVEAVKAIGDRLAVEAPWRHCGGSRSSASAVLLRLSGGGGKDRFRGAFDGHAYGDHDPGAN